MARTNDVWETGGGGTYIQTIGSPNGYDLLINGSNHYINFNIIVGSGGYGIRDNAGIIEFKNAGGSWAPLSSGGGTPAAPVNSIQYNNPLGTFAGDANFIRDITNATTRYGTYIGPIPSGAQSNYGLFLDNQVGAVNNWNIWTGPSLVMFTDPYDGQHALNVFNGNDVSIQSAIGDGEGAVFTVISNVSSANPNGVATGIHGIATSTGNQNVAALAGASAESFHQSSGLLTSQSAVVAYIENTGPVTNTILFDGGQPVITSSTITNLYGLFIGDIIAGSTINQAIHTGLGKIQFGDLSGTGTRIVTASSTGILGSTTTLGVANGGTGTTTSFTAGSVVFAGASGVYAQDNANFFYDSTNHRLSLGAGSSPTQALTIGTVAAPLNIGLYNTSKLQWYDSTGSLTSNGTITYYRVLTGATNSVLIGGTGSAGGTGSILAPLAVAGYTGMAYNWPIEQTGMAGLNAMVGFGTNSSGALGNILNLYNSGNAATSTGSGLVFSANRTTTGLTAFASIDMFTTNIGNTTYTGDLIFQTANASAKAERMRITSAGNVTMQGNLTLAGKITNYNGIATAGWGVPAIYGSGRSTAQTAAVVSVATYTVGAADGSFEISANVLVTTATVHNFTVTCTYTDEGNTARTITLTFSNVGGTLLTAITNTGGTVPYEGVPLVIRAKASTAITIATTGTFTTVVYNVEGHIMQIK